MILPLIDMISCFCTNESFSFSECQEMALSKPEHPKSIRNIHMFDNIWTEEKFPFRDSLRYVYDDILTNKKPNHNFWSIFCLCKKTRSKKAIPTSQTCVNRGYANQSYDHHIGITPNIRPPLVRIWILADLKE